jgi:hypothetical protein
MRENHPQSVRLTYSRPRANSRNTEYNVILQCEILGIGNATLPTMDWSARTSVSFCVGRYSNAYETQHLVILIASSIALVAAIAVAIAAYLPGKQPGFEDLPGLISALQAFSQDRTKPGQPLPSKVSLGELVSRGYISRYEEQNWSLARRVCDWTHVARFAGSGDSAS